MHTALAVSRPRRSLAAAPGTPSAAPAQADAWTLRAWPPLLWQAHRTRGLPLQHLGTRITPPDHGGCPSGQTFWAAPAEAGKAGVAWDWIELSQGIVALADPMSVVTNLRLLGERGEVLTALEAALYLNRMVHALPWQREVALALHGRPAPTQ